MTQLIPIAHIKSDFPTKFGIPRQSGIVEELKATVVFEKEYQNKDALRGLEEFSHIWLLWEFSEVHQEAWSPTVRPPKLGGNTRMGVFATRSPYRPNPIGMSCVKIDSIEFNEKKGPLIHVLGADLMNGTPIFDIKPYIPTADSFPNASAGFTKNIDNSLLQVIIAQKWADKTKEDAETIKKLLANDPRPAYQEDEKRIYAMEYKNYEIRFTVNNNVLTVTEVLLAK